ncbi:MULTISPECIES: MFS transporter [unclassified Staphylococcus]|uniref:MFS transporter n=1 Tax=unclassified Staphylococcus TaxID=91994 RepID=UPI0021D0A29E|nr:MULTISPECIES: MFS transporter [unclassified Staphylococcus]UXR76011.1 MFS transporter [Staphylococcus sp. IVB6233]UXR80208.1 MFS transporter [Staphylococcus sp. IVB6218]
MSIKQKSKGDINIFATLNKYRSARTFLIFSIFFYLSMYVSKTVHALWFDENNALAFFGFSYTMMAVAGSLSFFTGKIGDIVSPNFALKIGVIFYSVGLFLRIFTQSMLIAGLSGFIAGLGASLVIISMKFWILSIGTEEDRPAVASIKEISSSIGSTIGTTVSGILVALLAYFFSSPLLCLLILSSVFCLFTALLIPKFPKKEDKENGENNNSEIKSKLKYKPLIVRTIIFGVVAGLSISLINPFVPIILKNQGISISLIGFFMAVISVTAIFATPLFGNKSVNKHKRWIFFVCELLTGLTILLFLQKHLAVIVLVILILRATFQTGSIITQELMELEIYLKEYLGFLFGISQSAFFIGDALGGVMGGYVYDLNIKYALIICSSFFILNSIAFPIFYKYILIKNKERGNVLQ